MFSDGMHADKTCPNSVRLQVGARDLSNVCRGLFTRGYRGKVRDFTEHETEEQIFLLLFSCVMDACCF